VSSRCRNGKLSRAFVSPDSVIIDDAVELSRVCASFWPKLLRNFLPTHNDTVLDYDTVYANDTVLCYHTLFTNDTLFDFDAV
jgi:hypothetical protein